MILRPVASELKDKRIVIVADGALQYVPFGALPAPVKTDNVRTRPLIADHEIAVLPSASAVAVLRDELRNRPPARKLVAVLADGVFEADDSRLAFTSALVARRRGAPPGRQSKVETVAPLNTATRALRSFAGLEEKANVSHRLPFSRREAEAIMELVPQGEGLLALGFKASRATAVSPELSQYRYVHFATHGLLNSEHPELSGILLSTFDEFGKRQDGFLQLHEVYNLKLSADLVVLSACQTALGREIRGEGLIGLTRGFMYAGAPRCNRKPLAGRRRGNRRSHARVLSGDAQGTYDSFAGTARRPGKDVSEQSMGLTVLLGRLHSPGRVEVNCSDLHMDTVSTARGSGWVDDWRLRSRLILNL